MPRIIVTADWPADIVMLSERISVADLESGHFRAQLLERLSWAVSDAHATEQARLMSPIARRRAPQTAQTKLGLSRTRVGGVPLTKLLRGAMWPAGAASLPATGARRRRDRPSPRPATIAGIPRPRSRSPGCHESRRKATAPATATNA